MAKQNGQLKVGDTVQAIVSVWKEDENPTERNFFTGKVTQIIKRSKYAVYVRLQGLNDRIIPIDRVSIA